MYKTSSSCVFVPFVTFVVRVRNADPERRVLDLLRRLHRADRQEQAVGAQRVAVGRRQHDQPAASVALSVINVASAGPARPRCTEATSGLVATTSHASVPADGSNVKVTCAPARLTTKVSAAGARPFTSAGVVAGGLRGCVACS